MSIEAEDTDNFLVMTVVKEAIDKGLMTGPEGDILLLDQHPECTALQEVPTTGKLITTIEVTVGIPD